ncbi:MAG: TOMM precursor leader peptide-binding protein, partial [Acidobacteriota bacterium]
MSKLQISPRARVTATHQGVVATSPLGRFELKGSDVGQFLAGLVPLLDGSRTEQELAEAMPDYQADSVRSLLEQLRAKGIVEAVGHGQSLLAQAHVAIIGLESWAAAAAMHLATAGVGRLTLWDDQILSPGDYQLLGAAASQSAGQPRWQVLQDHLRRVAPQTHLDAGASPTAFGRADMGPVHTFAPTPSLVVLAARPEALLLRFQAARAAHAAGLPTLSVHMERGECWLGPATLAGPTPCWNCLRMRRLAVDDHIVQAHSVQAQLMGMTPAPAQPSWFPALAPAASQLLANEILGLLSEPPTQELHGRVRIHDLQQGTSVLHGLAPMPWCPVCDGARGALDRAREAGEDLSGAHNGQPLATDLADLLHRMEGWLDPRFGVMRSIQVQPAGPSGLLNATTRLANYTEGDARRVAPGALGGGKGLTPFESQVGAIGEAIERYSASRYRVQDLHRAKLDDLEGAAIDPRQLCFYDEAVYQASDNPYVPFDPATPIHWMRGHWFGTREPVWVPAVATLFGMHAEPHEQLLQISSSGLAAGSSNTDAALRAVFELLERDATMLSWLCRLPGQPIQLDGSLEPAMQQVVQHLQATGTRIELFLLDVGNGLPTVFGLAWGGAPGSPAVVASLACHGDPGVAARKALLELAQVLPYLGTIPPERIPTSADGVKTLEDHAFFYIPRGNEAAFEFLRAGDKPPVPLAELADPDFPSEPTAATEVLAGKLRDAGIRIATVDLTSPDTYFTPFRVARAVGIEVQPIHFGYRLRPLTNPRL